MKYLSKHTRCVLPFFAFLFALTACESIVSDYEGLPEPIEKLVVHSFISPQDTVIYVKVTASSPVFGVFKGQGFGYSVNGKDTVYFKGDAIENAKVTLSGTSSSVNLTYQKKEAVYSIDAKKFKIEAGKTYNLKVEANGKTAESSCTIPVDAIKIKKYTLDSVTTQGGGFGGQQNSKAINVSFEWDDLSNKANYYFVKSNIYADILSPYVVNGKVEYRKQKRFYIAQWNGEDFQNDIGLDGTTFTAKGEINLRSFGTTIYNGQRYQEKPVSGKFPLRMELLNVDINYYKYHLAVRQNRAEDLNPFVEPTPMYNNMKGGLGCFGASNKSVLEVLY